jgi:phytoene/squalene synthetase
MFTVHAFNIELLQVRQQTHGNPLAARMRYQWWREVIHALFQGEAGGAPTGALSGHPVVDCLRVVVRDCNLTQRWLEHILEVTPFYSWSATLPYLARTNIFFQI